MFWTSVCLRTTPCIAFSQLNCLQRRLLSFEVLVKGGHRPGGTWFQSKKLKACCTLKISHFQTVSHSRWGPCRKLLVSIFAVGQFACRWAGCICNSCHEVTQLYALTQSSVKYMSSYVHLRHSVLNDVCSGCGWSMQRTVFGVVFTSCIITHTCSIHQHREEELLILRCFKRKQVRNHFKKNEFPWLPKQWVSIPRKGIWGRSILTSGALTDLKSQSSSAMFCQHAPSRLKVWVNWMVLLNHAQSKTTMQLDSVAHFWGWALPSLQCRWKQPIEA